MKKLMITLLAGLLSLSLVAPQILANNGWYVTSYRSGVLYNGETRYYNNYVIMQGSLDSYRRLQAQMAKAGQYAQCIVAVHGRVLMVDGSGKPSNQIDTWEYGLYGEGSILRKYLESVIMMCELKIPVEHFPHHIAVVVYYPQINVWRVYLYNNAEYEGATQNKWEEYAAIMNTMYKESSLCRSMNIDVLNVVG